MGDLDRHIPVIAFRRPTRTRDRILRERQVKPIAAFGLHHLIAWRVGKPMPPQVAAAQTARRQKDNGHPSQLQGRALRKVMRAISDGTRNLIGNPGHCPLPELT